jgi:hypothetical protein
MTSCWLQAQLTPVINENVFGLSEKYCPCPPPPLKKHGFHGATDIIAPRISSWQSGIIKTEPYSANCVCCLWSLRGEAALSLR